MRVVIAGEENGNNGSERRLRGAGHPFVDGQKVRVAREQALLSRGELAKKAHLDPNTIARIERSANIAVRFRTLRELSEALGVQPRELEASDE